MNAIEKLTEEIVAFRDARDWKQFHNPKDCAITLSLEAAEVLEHFQWKNDTEMSLHAKAEKEAIAAELADVLNMVLLMSHDLEIDIEDALRKKIAKNGEKYPVDKSKGRHTKYDKL
jgi:NTP pyrophosphatase (non-canonical NTP hydrolase)